MNSSAAVFKLCSTSHSSPHHAVSIEGKTRPNLLRDLFLKQLQVLPITCSVQPASLHSHVKLAPPQTNPVNWFKKHFIVLIIPITRVKLPAIGFTLPTADGLNK